jgi:hypothetical protein
MEDLEMRLLLRRSGAVSRLSLLFSLTVVMVVAGCAGSSAATPFGNGGAAAAPAGLPAASAAGGPTTGGPEANGAGGGGSGSGSVGSGGDQLADLGAKIIRTGSLQLTVADVDSATRVARDTIRGAGGYVGASDEQRNGDSLVATITYRIPASHWEDALDAIRKLGTVVGEKTNATEVTAQLVDLEARIRNLKASEIALVGYAEKAPKTSDLLEIQARLTDTRGEIERLSAQGAQLSDQVALATLTVTFGTEVVAVTQAAARWDPAAEVDRASATLIGIVQSVISFLIVVAIVWIPVLVVVGVLAIIAIVVARRTGWGRLRGSPPLPPGPPPAAAPSGGD